MDMALRVSVMSRWKCRQVDIDISEDILSEFIQERTKRLISAINITCGRLEIAHISHI